MKYVEKDDEYDFYKNDGDKIWDVTENLISRGPVLFSFDKKKIYNFWEDYPQNLTKEEKELFDKEKPFWTKPRARLTTSPKEWCRNPLTDLPKGARR